jgi:hypothetical protein
MSRIKKFSQFVNEDYSFSDLIGRGKELIGRVGDWLKKIKDKYSDKLIGKGPNSGTPVVFYLDTKDGSVADQILSMYSNAGHDIESELATESINNNGIYEDTAHLKYGPGGVPDVKADVLKEKIVSSFKAYVTSGDTIVDPVTGKETQSQGPWDPIFIYGAPGIGKTHIVGQVVDELKKFYKGEMGFLKADIESFDPTDLLGVPSTVDLPGDDPFQPGVTKSNIPDWLPRDNGPSGNGGILFFDEMNRASGPVLGGLLKLLDTGEMGRYKLPSKWMIVAAGNRRKDEKDKSAITPLGKAFTRRLSVVNYLPTTKAWLKHIQEDPTPQKDVYGKKLKEIVLPDLVSFFDSGIGEMYFHDLLEDDEREIYANPASWVKASKQLYARMKVIKDEQGPDAKIPAQEVENIFTLQVGSEAAKAFMKFYFAFQAIDYRELNKIFTDAAKAPLPPKQDGVYKADDMYAWIGAVAIKSEELKPISPEVFGNIIDWSIRLDASEYAVSLMNKMFQVHDKSIKTNVECMKKLPKFSAKYTEPLDFEILPEDKP